jgi:hypothetical protein
MLKIMDFDSNARTVHPTVPSKEDVQRYVIPAERHDAYSFMWNSITYFGVVANTAMWMYM